MFDPYDEHSPQSTSPRQQSTGISARPAPDPKSIAERAVKPVAGATARPDAVNPSLPGQSGAPAQPAGPPAGRLPGQPPQNTPGRPAGAPALPQAGAPRVVPRAHPAPPAAIPRQPIPTQQPVGPSLPSSGVPRAGAGPGAARPPGPGVPGGLPGHPSALVRGGGRGESADRGPRRSRLTPDDPHDHDSGGHGGSGDHGRSGSRASQPASGGILYRVAFAFFVMAVLTLYVLFPIFLYFGAFRFAG